MISYECKLRSIIRSEPWLMQMLRSVRQLDLPDWYITAGAIRNTVWDVLSEKRLSERSALHDIDVVYVDFHGDTCRSQMVEQYLSSIFSDYSFEVSNVAGCSRGIFGDVGVKSSVDYITRLPETVSSVGIRLDKHDSLSICAPYGLEDLFLFKVRKTPLLSLEEYESRKVTKGWSSIWPRVQYVD